jgi:hypothetical protein
MRHIPFVLVASAVTLSFACHRAPEEKIVPAEAGAPAPLGSLVGLPPALGGGAGPDAGADAGRADLRDFCTDAYTADATRMGQRCSPKDVGFARSLARAASNLCADDMNAAVARGRTSYDADAAKQCIQMLQASDVPRTSDTDTFFQHFPCDRVLLGTQADGQPCRFSIECKDDLTCVGYAISVDGACKKPAKTGEACSMQRFGSILNEQAATMHHPECASAAWCDGKTCQARIAAGQACVNATSCVAGLTCVMGKCGKIGGPGAGCFASSDCAFGSWCNRTPEVLAGGTKGKCEAKRPASALCPAVDACKGRCDMPPPGDGGQPTMGRCIATCGSG